ncbi:hypothetical protein [Pseudomonas sp.]|uniref:hypothetical protein n=1 Tax=Pseudomonas sp. TaxID=306 RepID=UPI002906FBED|nr:hypothetical protein [Pseudomonas sp.]MDU4254507.1 hypothetical protein [Pseudomonas sp.]
MAQFDRVNIGNLEALLAAVGNRQLHVGQVAGDKPGILAGDIAVCRLREGPEGAQYAALIVGAVNALPAILNALQAPTEALAGPSAAEDSPLRQQIEAKLTETLQLLPGFKAGAIGVWPKLLYAAVEPWLAGGRDALTAEPAPVQQRQQPARSAGGEKQARLDAVMEFCHFMLAEADEDSRPNELALEKWVADWDKAHNGALPAPGAAH